MSLLDEFVNLRDSVREKLASRYAFVERGVATVDALGLAERAVRVGQPALTFAPPRAGGGISLTHAVRRGLAVIVFYRGEWCPFCNLHLRAFEKASVVDTSGTIRFAHVDADYLAGPADPEAVLDVFRTLGKWWDSHPFFSRVNRRDRSNDSSCI